MKDTILDCATINNIRLINCFNILYFAASNSKFGGNNGALPFIHRKKRSFSGEKRFFYFQAYL